jgi:TolB protein
MFFVYMLILLGFLAGEILLALIISRVYDHFAARGAAPRRFGAKVRTLALALFLPVGYGLAALLVFGAVQAYPGISMEDLVPEPTTAFVIPATPDPAGPDLPPPVPGTGATPETTQPPIQTPDTDPSPPETLIQTPTVSIEPGEIPSGQIVYTCQIYRTRLRDQICLVNPDGTGYRRLTLENNWAHNFASLSPDGRSVVYVAREPGGVFQVFEMDLDSGETVQLTNFENNASAPEISPDGRSIVFNRIWEGADTIWVMDRDGSNLRLVFGPPRGSGWDPVWSPDGSWILFASDRGGDIQLYTIDVEGVDLSQVTQFENLRGRSDWSPDGTAIATYSGEPWLREIIIMNPDGSDPRLITNGGNNLAPSFSPDGSWIAFTSYRDKYREELGCEIYIMPRDGSRVLRLTADDICNWQPRWGPAAP